MNKEDLKTAAKDFCEAEYIDPNIWVTKQVSGHILIKDVLVKFLQSMIEKGKFVDVEKWHPLVLKFANQMQSELNDNLHKGDWSEWRDVKEILYEMDYHKAKLIIALKDNNKTLIRELLADCGNFLMFLGNAGYVYDLPEQVKMLDADEPGFNMYFGTQSTPVEPALSSDGKEVKTVGCIVHIVKNHK